MENPLPPIRREKFEVTRSIDSFMDVAPTQITVSVDPKFRIEQSLIGGSDRDDGQTRLRKILRQNRCE